VTTQRPSDPAAWETLHEICAALPGTTHRLSHGEIAWFAGEGKKARSFASTWDHHHDDRNAVLFAAPPGAQEQLIRGDPVHYFRPPYVGGRGWVGIYLDVADIDWDLIELHLTDAHAWIAR
jgi:hypothetical protein